MKSSWFDQTSGMAPHATNPRCGDTGIAVSLSDTDTYHSSTMIFHCVLVCDVILWNVLSFIWTLNLKWSFKSLVANIARLRIGKWVSGVWVYIIQLFCYYQMFKVKPCSASNGGMQTLSALNQMAKVCPDFVDVKTHRSNGGKWV